MKIERAISYAIFNQDEMILLVERPSNDPDLPDVWGLPAGTVIEGESIEESVTRSGYEKLGVALRPTAFIGRGHKMREKYLLLMEVFEARIIQGEPKTGQDYPGVTQYKGYKWGDVSELRNTATHGSLCSEVFLNNCRRVYNRLDESPLDTERDTADTI